MLEEHENQETSLQDLIDLVERDDLPTNEFTIQDKDPMVILGKLNKVIAYLETLQATINASDSKANEALQKAIQAVADATQALSVANGIDAKATQALANAIEAVGTANTALSASNTALSTANTAISTANTALSSANSAVETAENALDTAESAETKADTAITTANGAKTTAEGIDAKATTALSNSQTAVSTANTAETKAQEALDQVVAGTGTKVYRDTTLLSNLDIKPIEDDIANNTTAITALQTGKVNKVAGKQLSTEDFTTAEKNKLAGLNNYDDTQVQADITALQTGKVNKVAGKQLSTEDFTTAEKNKLAGLNNYDDTQVQDDLSSLSSNKADKINANQSIVAKEMTATRGDFANINNSISSLSKRIGNVVYLRKWNLPVTNIEVSYTNAGLAAIDCTPAFGDAYTSDVTLNPIFEVLIAIEAYDDGTNFVKSYSDFTGENTTISDMRFSTNGRQGGAIRVMPLYTTLYFNKTSSMGTFKIKVMAWRKITGNLI